jgi:hypothetical protein
VPEFATTYGPVLIGLLFSAGLLGITISQAFTYHNYFPKDKRILKAVVYYVVFMEALRLGLGFHGVYYHILAYWGNASIPKPAWTSEIFLLLSALTEVAVRLYFAYRVYIMSQRNLYITTLLVTLCLAHMSVGVATWGVSFINQNLSAFTPVLHNLGTASLALSVTTDWCISLSLIYFLLRNRSGMANTDTIINRIVFYTINMGLITSCFDICVLGLSLWNSPHPQLYSIALYQIVGNLYANSLLASLNSRITLRHTPTAHVAMSDFSAFEARSGRDTDSTVGGTSSNGSKGKLQSGHFVSFGATDSSLGKHGVDVSQSVSYTA